jgi:hypothetical protein
MNSEHLHISSASALKALWWVGRDRRPFGVVEWDVKGTLSLECLGDGSLRIGFGGLGLLRRI